MFWLASFRSASRASCSDAATGSASSPLARPSRSASRMLAGTAFSASSSRLATPIVASMVSISAVVGPMWRLAKDMALPEAESRDTARDSVSPPSVINPSRAPERFGRSARRISW
ncbi:Uncharacterised protein [Mycobacteroides abscessus subsp. abscessus]|nr:Uncharacterised protein [Mycobacteroides abscessus subsp. abscessus]